MMVESKVLGCYEVDRGTYDTKNLGQTSHGDHFRPSGIGAHVTPTRSSQQVSLGGGYYECGKIGHLASMHMTRGGVEFGGGR